MITYKQGQEYNLKVVNTNNEVKDIQYIPEKDMSKPEVIMALKSKYKNFFKLIEAKQVDFTSNEDYTAYVVDKDFDLDTLPDDVNYTLVHKLPKAGTKMFLTTRPFTDEECNKFNIRLNPAELTNTELRDLFSESKLIKKENVEIEKHREDKLNKLHSDIRYNFEEAYKDWGNAVSKIKADFVNEYMSEFCNDFEEVNWRDYIVAIPEIDDIYAEYKNVEDWEIPEDVKLRQYELITNYVQNYLKGVYSKMEEAKSSGPVIVISYGRGTRFPDRKTAIEYYKECVAGTDPNGAENYSYQNILYELMHTNKDVVYDTDDVTEYDWWIQKGKPTDDISDELLKAHLEEDNNMKSEVNAEEFVKDIDTMKKLDIWDGKDSTYEKSKQKLKDIQDVNKELNVKEENLDIDEKVLANGFVGQPLSMVLSYTGDGHDIADRDYDCAVWFPPVDELDDTDNYDLYMQALSQVLKVAERFDLDDDNIIVNISEYAKRNQDTLLDLFEVNGETEEEKFEDLVCRVMPLIISGYTTDNTYKLLLSGIKGGK